MQSDLTPSAGQRVRRKPAVKSDRIVSRLRQDIVSGTFELGARLPIRPEMERRFDVSTNTLQRALDQLGQEGFIVARGNRGTFVTTDPPFLKRYGLVVRGQTGVAPYSTLLFQEALRLKQQSSVDLSIYQNVGASTDTEGYRTLAADLRAQRLAGLILEVPWVVAETPLAQLWQNAGVPVIGLGGEPKTPDMLILHNDGDQLIARVLDRFVALGRRRVAVLADDFTAATTRQLTEAIRQRGLVTQPYWLQAVNAVRPMAARAAMHLLMQARDLPDALWITDDTLVEPATAGLMDAGTRVPAELEVVAHCNFPYPTPSHLKVRRAGFSVSQLMTTALDLIDRRRRGETVPTRTALPALLEDEWSEPARGRPSLVAEPNGVLASTHR